MAPVSISTFATTQLSLLDAELKAELEETNLLVSQTSPTALQRAGAAILNLQVSSQRTGLGGKTVVELELDSAVGSGDLPEHGIRVGDIVGVQEQPSGSAKKKEKSELKDKGVTGVVLRVGKGNVNVALDKEDVDVPGGKLWLFVPPPLCIVGTKTDLYDSVKLANDVTYKRMNQTMLKMEKMSEAETTPFMRVLFGHSSPTPVPKDLADPEYGLDKIEWFDPSLNESQQEAVKFAIASEEVALIHGPPGTGKTHTLIELIRQLLKQNLRLLVCGPSNISVDNIVERLAPHKVSIIRLGHPARLLPSVVNHSLDVLTRTSDAAAIVQDVRKEMDLKQASIRKTKSGRERRQIYGDLKELRKEYRERERKCVDNLVGGSKVVLATLHGAGGYHLKGSKFDVVIIDEAGQALEAQCWVPLIGASKVVVAGDHLQLPPTIKSLNSKDTKKKEKKAAADEREELPGMTLETTLFDRLLALHGPGIKKMLTTQYRMHERIMAFPSAELYEGKLIAAEGVKRRLLKDLPYPVEDTDDTREPLIFWDTQGEDFPETDAADPSSPKSLLGESKSNSNEAAIVRNHVRSLVDSGVRTEDIAVITPYNAQLSVLRALMREEFEGLELGSVDGFQGREKEAVVVSLVRSGGEVGFLGEKRRLNVSMTRPRRQLCVVGDSETLSKGSKFLKKWMSHLEEHAELRFATLDDITA